MPFFLHVKGVTERALLDYFDALPPSDFTVHSQSATFPLLWPILQVFRTSELADEGASDYRADVPLWACSQTCPACCYEHWADRFNTPSYRATDEDRARIRKAMGEDAPSPPLAPYVSVHPTAQLAREALERQLPPSAYTVTFAATAQEIKTYRERESNRCARQGIAGCQVLPWADLDWQVELNKAHFAFLSVTFPGKISYTPSHEWGVTDRQLSVRPGRYLEQFAPSLSARERDELCAQVKAANDRNATKYATTESDVVRVYREGPNSCMSHAPRTYASSSHPAIVYAQSPDLQLAYLGTLGDYDDKIRARALVWPDRKIHSRVYGDETLRILLEREGYRKGDVFGARVRALVDENHEDAYIMPFVDGCGWAKLVDKGKHFQFVEDTDGGDYECQNTNGLTDGGISSQEGTDDDGDDYETHFCAHCGDNAVDDAGDECQRCDDMRYSCAHCDEVFHDQNPSGIDNYGVVCDDCYGNLERTCDECDTSYYAESMNRATIAERKEYGATHLCGDCGETFIADVKAANIIEADNVRRAAICYALETALQTNSFRGDAE